MSSEKKIITYDEFWDFLKSEAATRGWNDTTFMRNCVIPRQRYYEFGMSRHLTSQYMAKLMEGLNLKREEVEKKSGRRFSEEQITELRRESWIAAHRDIIDGLVQHPELIPILRQQIDLQKKK